MRARVAGTTATALAGTTTVVAGRGVVIMILVRGAGAAEHQIVKWNCRLPAARRGPYHFSQVRGEARMTRRRGNLLRAKDDAAAGRVAFVELFYDLVFVFAITQLSHLLLHHYTQRGTLETALLLLAVWWVWIYTTWALNWLDPQRAPVRVMIYASMLLGLFMSMSIPEAFGERGLAFATSFVAMQLGRSLFTSWCVADQPTLSGTFQRISVWMAASGVFWIAGGVLAGDARLAAWVVALGIEYVGPMAALLDADARIGPPRRRTGRCGASISPSGVGSSSSSASARRC